MSEYAHPESIVSTQWVADHLSDPNIRIIDVIWGMDEVAGLPAYESGHIPGAVAWDFIGELTRHYGDAINGNIPDKISLAHRFQLFRAGCSVIRTAFHEYGLNYIVPAACIFQEFI